MNHKGWGILTSMWSEYGKLEGSAGIVVGVDGSDQSLCALVWAAKEAERRRTPLHVVTAYTVPIFAASSMDAGYTTMDDAIIRDGARSVLNKALERISAYNIEVFSRVETGDAAAVLLELSEEADLMVVGSRGRGGFVGRLLGSVSSALPAHAKCPTVVVPLRTAGRLPEAGVRPPAGRRPNKRSRTLWWLASTGRSRGAPLPSSLRSRR